MGLPQPTPTTCHLPFPIYETTWQPYAFSDNPYWLSMRGESPEGLASASQDIQLGFSIVRKTHDDRMGWRERKQLHIFGSRKGGFP